MIFPFLRRKAVKFFVIIFSVLSLVLLIIPVIWITFEGLNPRLPKDKVDVILVYGNMVEKTGEPSGRLKSRLDKTIEIYKNKNAPIVVSGGFGKEGFEEATVMKNYLVQKDILADQIIEDKNGSNTQKTADNLFQMKVNNGQNWQKVLIVTQYFHISRSKLSLEKYGFEVYFAAANFFELRDFYSIPREVLGIWVYNF